MQICAFLSAHLHLCSPSSFRCERSQCQEIPQRISLLGLLTRLLTMLFVCLQRKNGRIPAERTGYSARIDTKRHSQLSPCAQSYAQILI